jgi:hypothetical protein
MSNQLHDMFSSRCSCNLEDVRLPAGDAGLRAHWLRRAVHREVPKSRIQRSILAVHGTVHWSFEYQVQVVLQSPDYIVPVYLYCT